MVCKTMSLFVIDMYCTIFLCTVFYVAGAYQLSHAFKDSPTLEGLLYFVASYLPIFLIWHEKLIYDARFTPDDNLFHRSLEIVHLCLLGLMISYIQPSDKMKHTCGDITMTIFTGTHICITWLGASLYYDVAKNVVGGEEARHNARHEMIRKMVASLLYVAAFVVAAGDYIFVNTDDCMEQAEKGNRWPAYLIVVGSLCDWTVFPLVLSFVLIPSWGISHKQVMVPINIEYMIHRIGEWVMLMLGESVLSILTITHAPSTTTIPYAISFCAGILTVTMFQYLFFRTQPAEAKDHASRRSQVGGYFYIYCHTLYSASLILVGCAYKMMLSGQDILEQEEEEPVAFDISERIATVYAMSQAVSFLSLDLMTISHRGFKVNFSRFRPYIHGRARCAIIPTICMFLDFLLIGLTLCLSFVHDLTLLSVLGCLLVLCQVVLRTIGLKYFPVTIAQMERACHPGEDCSFGGTKESGVEEDEEDHRRWPNVTEPVSVSVKGMLD